jgi:hypothetical protein
MRRLILVALAATAICSPALARDNWNGSGFALDHRTPADRWFGSDYTLSVPSYGGQPNARIITIPEPRGDDEREALDATIKRWTEHCRPAPHVDALGVTRLTYAHPGCAFGEGE